MFDNSSTVSFEVVTFPDKVKWELGKIETMLVEKNKAYGNSALEPIRIFSKEDADAGIRQRIDDKLSRLARGTDFADEDTISDLIGYLVLLKISMEDK